MTIEIRWVDPLTEFDAAIPLLQANWLETGQPIPFIVNDVKLFYKYYIDSNSLFAAGVFDDNKMVGYCIVTITPHPLNHAIKICSVNGIYLIPELRGGKTSVSMLNAVRVIAKCNNANTIHWHASHNSDFLKVLESRFIPMSSYFREELTYDN